MSFNKLRDGDGAAARLNETLAWISTQHRPLYFLEPASTSTNKLSLCTSFTSSSVVVSYFSPNCASFLILPTREWDSWRTSEKEKNDRWHSYVKRQREILSLNAFNCRSRTFWFSFNPTRDQHRDATDFFTLPPSSPHLPPLVFNHRRIESPRGGSSVEVNIVAFSLLLANHRAPSPSFLLESYEIRICFFGVQSLILLIRILKLR